MGLSTIMATEIGAVETTMYCVGLSDVAQVVILDCPVWGRSLVLLVVWMHSADIETRMFEDVFHRVGPGEHHVQHYLYGEYGEYCSIFVFSRESMITDLSVIVIGGDEMSLLLNRLEMESTR